MKVSFDTDIMSQVGEHLGSLFLYEEAAESLAEFIKLKKEMEVFEEGLKEMLKIKALALDPNFKSIQGDKVKISFRESGPKYQIDPSRLKEVDKSFYREETVIRPEKEVIDLYIQAKGEVPKGIFMPKRIKTISISLREKE